MTSANLLNALQPIHALLLAVEVLILANYLRLWAEEEACQGVRHSTSTALAKFSARSESAKPVYGGPIYGTSIVFKTLILIRALNSPHGRSGTAHLKICHVFNIVLK